MSKHPIQLAAEALASDLNTVPRIKRTTPVFVNGSISRVSTGIGNVPAGSRFFTTRLDVSAHMHKPGQYYCGRCMRHVVV